MRVCLSVSVCVCVCVFICIFVCLNQCIYVRVCRISLVMCLGAHVCVCVCVCVCLIGVCPFVGLFFIIPCMDSYTKVDLRTVSFDVPPQEVSERERRRQHVCICVLCLFYVCFISVSFGLRRRGEGFFSAFLHVYSPPPPPLLHSLSPSPTH